MNRDDLRTGMVMPYSTMSPIQPQGPRQHDDELEITATQIAEFNLEMTRHGGNNAVVFELRCNPDEQTRLVELIKLKLVEICTTHHCTVKSGKTSSDIVIISSRVLDPETTGTRLKEELLAGNPVSHILTVVTGVDLDLYRDSIIEALVWVTAHCPGYTIGDITPDVTNNTVTINCSFVKI
jgi:hypothetical protein